MIDEILVCKNHVSIKQGVGESDGFEVEVEFDKINTQKKDIKRPLNQSFHLWSKSSML